MRKATESAAKWLTERVRANPKLNPIPYPFFKSIINKQIEWAAKRGVTLSFEELAESVRSELLKAGIHTMADSRKQNQPANSSHEDLPDTGGAIPLCLYSLARSVRPCARSQYPAGCRRSSRRHMKLIHQALNSQHEQVRRHDDEQ